MVAIIEHLLDDLMRDYPLALIIRICHCRIN